MPPHIRDPLAVARPQWVQPFVAGEMMMADGGMSMAAPKGSEPVAAGPMGVPSTCAPTLRADAQVSLDWLQSLPTSFKMDMVADFVAGLWESEVTEFHRTTLRQIGLDLVQNFGVCDHSLLVSVHYLTRLKDVFDRAGIRTQDCSAQLFTVALLAAVKFLCDVPPSNADWADVSHFERQRMNQMELELLEALDFNLFVEWPDCSAALYEVVEHRSARAVDARLQREAELAHAQALAHAHHGRAPSPACWSDPTYPADHSAVAYCEPPSLQSCSTTSFAAVPHPDDYVDHSSAEVSPDFAWHPHEVAGRKYSAARSEAPAASASHLPDGWFHALDSSMKQGHDDYDMWSYEPGVSVSAAGMGVPGYGAAHGYGHHHPAYVAAPAPAADMYRFAMQACHGFVRDGRCVGGLVEYDMPRGACNPGMPPCCVGAPGVAVSVGPLAYDARLYSDSLFATATF